MGLLSIGTPLSWQETKKHADHVRKHGILQFLAQYHKLQHRKKDVLYWGDEIEYQIVKFDDVNKKVYVSTRSSEILEALGEKNKQSTDTNASAWHWEFAQYMIEGTPGKPYGGMLAHFNTVQSNMEKRRKEVEEELQADEAILSLSVFPRLGCPDFTWPPLKTDPVNGASKSIFFPDTAVCQGHIRFLTLTRNVRSRRDKKVTINVPIFKDVNTPSPFIEDFAPLGDDGESAREAKPDHIYMDCVGFGMGNCCLQVTFQACSLDEARSLYDQLAPLCPIMLALSSASPIYRGYLSDIDCRWPVVSQSVDDRTDEELGLKPLKNDRYRIAKSRYDSVDSYISHAGRCYNDIDLVFDQDLCDQLKKGGVDDLLAQHIAHLFIRDPISLFEEKLNLNDEEDTDHFENIQSTNWQSLRFKPPPANSNIGWRVEFRPMEAQLTDFENAAFTVFIVLMTRVILSYKLNLVIPISKVDENMKTSYKNGSVIKDKFYFRKDVLTESTPLECSQICQSCLVECPEDPSSECTPMTMNEIFHGKDDFTGLIPLINLYLDSIDLDVDTRCSISQYLKLISHRASGKLQTCAQWTRNFVTKHPDYKQDSVVSDSIAYDLLKRMTEISNAKASEPSFIFDYSTKSSDIINQAVSRAEAFINTRSPPSSQSELAEPTSQNGSSDSSKVPN